MGYKRLKILIAIMLFLTTILSSCKYINNEENININLFSTKDAMLVGKQYLQLAVDGNFNEARNLCTKELLSDNKNIDDGVSRIISFKLDKIIESTNSSYNIFDVIRKSNEESKSDLDSFAIKVIKENNTYKIAEIKAVNKQQLFEKANSLRIIGEDGGKSSLVVRLSNIPKDVYLKENKVMMYKDIVPNSEFGIVSTSYTGGKVAFSTIGEDKSFLALGILEPDLAVGPADATSEALDNIEEALEKPIIKKLIPLDILQGVKLQAFVFTEEEDDVVVQYNTLDGVDRMKVYSTSDGNLIPIAFDKVFPEGKYNIQLKSLDKNAIIIRVSAVEGANVKEELLGEYKVDMETLNMDKQ